MTGIPPWFSVWWGATSNLGGCLWSFARFLSIYDRTNFRFGVCFRGLEWVSFPKRREITIPRYITTICNTCNLFHIGLNLEFL